VHWRVFAIGKPKLAYAKSGVEEYAARLRPVVSLEIEWLKNSTRESESAALLERSTGYFRITMDERGEHLASRAFAGRLAQWEQSRTKGIALLIGGADGHTEELRKQSDWLWSLSKLTLQHELALVVALEQIYRAYAIKANLPYHRD